MVTIDRCLNPIHGSFHFRFFLLTSHVGAPVGRGLTGAKGQFQCHVRGSIDSHPPLTRVLRKAREVEMTNHVVASGGWAYYRNDNPTYIYKSI